MIWWMSPKDQVHVTSRRGEIWLDDTFSALAHARFKSLPTSEIPRPRRRLITYQERFPQRDHAGYKNDHLSRRLPFLDRG